MKAVRFVLVLVIAWGMQSGVSYAMADWLDKLSGPGPFRGWTVSYRFLCVTNTADQTSFRKVSITDATLDEQGRTVATWLGPHERTAFVVPRRAPMVDQNPPSMLTEAGLRDYRKGVAETDCKRDQRLRGYVSVTAGLYNSYENQLFPNDLSNHDHRVRISELSVTYTRRLQKALDVYAGVGISRFSGPAFDTFYHGSFTPLGLEFAPVALKNDGTTSRVLKFGVALTTFFPGFDSHDFCNPDIVSCAGIRADFKSRAELIPKLSVTVDVSQLLP